MEFGGESLAFGFKRALINVHQELVFIVRAWDLELDADTLHLHAGDPFDHVVVAVRQFDFFDRCDLAEDVDANIGSYRSKNKSQDCGTIVGGLTGSFVEVLLFVNMSLDREAACFGQVSWEESRSTTSASLIELRW